MSSLNFDQLREELLRLPLEAKRTIKSALQLEPTERQKLLDELTEQKPIQHPEVKVHLGEARDYTREMKWLRENAHLYPGQHLAVNGDQLLAYGADGGKVFDAAKATGQRFLMHRSPEKGEIWGGGGWL